MPKLRDTEAEASSELQRLVLARETLDGEERRAKNRTAELERRIAQTTSDIVRETALIEDAASVLARLDAEAKELASQGTADAEIDSARGQLSAAEAALALTEKALAEAQDKDPRWRRGARRLRPRCGKRRPGSRGSKPKSKR